MRLTEDQVEGIDFIREVSRGGIFADIGVGKTAIALHAIWHLLGDLKVRAVCVVAPIRVIEEVWRQEAKLWRRTKILTFALVRGQPKQRLRELEKAVDVFLINPDLIPWLCTLRRWPFDMIIFDESTMFKNPSSKRFKRIQTRLRRCPRRYIMTGTPTPNTLLNLWSQMYLVDRGLALGDSYYWYKRRFFYPIDYQGYKWVPLPGSRRHIMREINPKVFRIETPEYSKVHIKENNIWVSLPPAARDKYNRMERHFLFEVRHGLVTAANAAVKSNKLLQLSNGFAYTTEHKPRTLHMKKIEALEELVDEIGKPVLVVYHYLHERDKILDTIPQAEMLDIQKWNKGKQPVALLHPASAGHGLNLQFGGHHMIMFGLQHSRERYDQVIGRLARRGQKFTVFVHRILARETLDLVVDEILHGRYNEQRDFLQALKHYKRGEEDANYL